MASIRSQLILTDRMTGPLRGINRALNLVLNSFESMQSASGRAIDTAAIQEAREELARVNRSLDQLEQNTNNNSDAFSRLAKAIGLVVVARKAFDVIKTGVNYASDLAEAQNVIDVTFGNSAPVVDAWAKTALEAYGMNEVSAKRYVGTMGAMLKSSGLAGDAIVSMSQDMVGLAGDMASFYNLDLAVAFEKIQSGISGETEPLKQLGINMSVANLEAYALAQGIDKSYNSMSQAEQVMLRYNYLMSATADAQGDFARTSDSWANQNRLLSENWLEFTGVLASQLLPALTGIVTAFNSFITFLTANADTVSAVILGIAVAVGILAVAWGVHAAAQWLAVAANQALIVSLLSNPILWIAIIIGVLVAMIYKWIQSVGGLTNAWNICKLALIVGWNAVKLAFFTGVYWVIDLIAKLQLAWQKAGVAISNFLGDMKVAVLTILQNMINGAIDLINDFISLLNKIPGVNIEAIEHVTFAATAAAENEAAKQARSADLAAYEQGLADAKAGRDAHLASLQAELNSSVDALQTAYAQGKAQAAADSGAEQLALDSLGADTGSIADSAGRAADGAGSAASSLKETTEDLKYMRDLAEQEAINRFTTAEVKIDMTGMTNRIDSDIDLDGVLNTFTAGFAEAIEIAAEGVHA